MHICTAYPLQCVCCTSNMIMNSSGWLCRRRTPVKYLTADFCLLQVYFEPLKKPRTPTLIDAGQVDVIFYQIPNLQSCHESFLQQLTDRVSDWHNQQKIGDIFVNQVSLSAAECQFN